MRQLDVAKLAVAYRGLVLWVGIQLAIGAVGAAAMAAVTDPGPLLVIALMRLLGLLITIVALTVYAYRTAAALGSRVGVVWALAMIVPLINLLTLLLLSSAATKACRSAGIKVGLLGPKDFQPPSDGGHGATAS